jgi:hypothetical protein
MVLGSMINRLTETGRRFRVDMNEGKNKVMRISRQPSPIQILTDQKQPENVDCFSNLGSVITKMQDWMFF